MKRTNRCHEIIRAINNLHFTHFYRQSSARQRKIQWRLVVYQQHRAILRRLDLPDQTTLYYFVAYELIRNVAGFSELGDWSSLQERVHENSRA